MMFKDSKVYKDLYEVYRVMDIYENSYRVLEQSRHMIEREYPKCTKKEDLRLDFNNVKGKVDSIKNVSKELLVRSEGLIGLGEDFKEKFDLLISELKANITRIDENIGRFVSKYELIDTTDEIKPKKAKSVRTLLTDTNMKGLIFGETNHKKRNMAVALVDEELRNELLDSEPKKEDSKVERKERKEDTTRTERKEDTTRVVEMSEESKSKVLENYRRHKMEVLKRFDFDTTEIEEQLEKVKSENKPKLTKGQIKKLTSPFRNKMSACHKYYNEIKGNLTEEGIVNVYEHTEAILHEFGNVKDYLNNVDLDELNALLKRLDKLSLVKPGLLSYDFSEYRVQIEECKRVLLNK